MLETTQSEDNAYVTLTYSEADLPSSGSLVPEHLSGFIKALRTAYYPLLLRFYGVGEYGDASFRPHYHLALFNFPTCRFLQSRYSARRQSCCEWCDLVRDAWGKGMVSLGTLTPESAAYVSGYVTKKMTYEEHYALKGRHPEFARMSLRPGIGAGFVDEIASTILQTNIPTGETDVPAALRHGKRILPLGRYLRGRLRERLGHAKTASPTSLEVQKQEVQALRDLAEKNDTTFVQEVAKSVVNLEGSALARFKISQSRSRRTL